MEIEEGIKLMLKKRGMTHRQLVAKSGVDVLSFMNGSKKPTKRTIIKLAKAFDIKPEHFVMLGLEKSNVPKARRKFYDLLYPAMKNVLLDIL